MARGLVLGCVAALAVGVLMTAVGTWATFDDAADVPSSFAGAGILKLDLGGSGAGTALSFPYMQPGALTTRRLWVAANDATSAVAATLAITVHHLVDVPGSCDLSLGKAEGEFASGISGCSITPDGITGTPRIGVTSRMLDVSATYVSVAVDPATCATQSTGSSSLLPKSGQGDLYDAAMANGGAGTTVPVIDANGHPVVLAPGRGVCFSVTAYWPSDVTDAAHASPEHPVDNAAQGDSFSVDFRFDLSQVAS